VIHRVKSMWFQGDLEVALTHCGEHGHIVENGDVVKIQTAWEFLHATHDKDKVDCPRCMMEALL
jgi:hypothetical protein